MRQGTLLQGAWPVHLTLRSRPASLHTVMHAPTPAPAPARPCRPDRRGRRRGAPLAVPGLLALLAVVTGLAGCQRGEPTGSTTGLTPEEFIAVIVELREAERAAVETDSAAEVYARSREEILTRHGTSEAEIRAFIETASRDIPAFTEMWEDISTRLRRPVADDTL